MDPWAVFDNYPHRITTEDKGGYPDCFFLCVLHYLRELHDPRLPQTASDLRNVLADELAIKYQDDGPPTFDHVIAEIKRVQPNLSIATWKEYLTALRETLYGGDLEIQALIAWMKQQGLRIQVRIYSLFLDTVHVQAHGADSPTHVWRFAHLGAHYRVVVDSKRNSSLRKRRTAYPAYDDTTSIPPPLITKRPHGEHSPVIMIQTAYWIHPLMWECMHNPESSSWKNEPPIEVKPTILWPIPPDIPRGWNDLIRFLQKGRMASCPPVIRHLSKQTIEYRRVCPLDVISVSFSAHKGAVFVGLLVHIWTRAGEQTWYSDFLTNSHGDVNGYSDIRCNVSLAEGSTTHGWFGEGKESEWMWTERPACCRFYLYTPIRNGAKVTPDLHRVNVIEGSIDMKHIKSYCQGCKRPETVVFAGENSPRQPFPELPNDAVLRFGYYLVFVSDRQHPEGDEIGAEITDFSVSLPVSLPTELSLRQVPMYWRFIPEVTRFSQKNSSQELIFHGFTIDGQLILREADKYHVIPSYNASDLPLVQDTYPGNATSWASLSIPLRESILGSQGKAYAINESPQLSLLHKRLLSLLQRQTIRGINIYELLTKMVENDGISYSIAVTGGAVRDLLARILHEKKSKTEVTLDADIDLVISAPYNALEIRLKDIFGSLGDPLTGNTFRCAGRVKSFGQYKVMHKSMITTEAEDLDIALFKSMRMTEELRNSPEISKAKESKDNQYLYGWSYATDAKQRDFSINALYMEVFGEPPYLIDPTGNGISDLQNGILRCIDIDDFLLHDLGGQFRLHKMMRTAERSLDIARLKCEPENLSEQVSLSITNRLQDLKDLSHHDLPEAIKETGGFLMKLQRKLFKDPRQLNENIQSILDSGVSWWPNVIEFVARDAASLVDSVIAQNSEDLNLLALIGAIRGLYMKPC